MEIKTPEPTLVRQRKWKPGEHTRSRGLTTEVLEVSERQAPSKVVFRFDKSLDSSEWLWLSYDWRRGYRPFVLPRIGETM